MHRFIYIHQVQSKHNTRLIWGIKTKNPSASHQTISNTKPEKKEYEQNPQRRNYIGVYKLCSFPTICTQKLIEISNHMNSILNHPQTHPIKLLVLINIQIIQFQRINYIGTNKLSLFAGIKYTKKIIEIWNHIPKMGIIQMWFHCLERKKKLEMQNLVFHSVSTEPK